MTAKTTIMASVKERRTITVPSSRDAFVTRDLSIYSVAVSYDCSRFRSC